MAAWPDADTRSALAQVAARLRTHVEHGRATHIEDFHLTLAFIGDVGNAAAAVQAIEQLRFRPFDWQLDTLGSFEQAGVVCAGSQGGAADRPLIGLARRVRRVLARLGVGYDDRPLAPHVTLLRGVRGFSAIPILPISWRIHSIALYRSTGHGPGPQYSRV